MVTGRANDESKLSTKPKQIRNRLRRHGKKFDRDLELYFEHGYGKPIEEWDLEELSRGRPRNKGGTFGGSTPTWINPIVAREAKRRLLEHCLGSMAGHADLAIKTISDLLKSRAVDDNGKPIVDARTKLEAAKFIIENVVGKPKNRLEIDTTDAVREFLAEALVLDDGEPAHPIIDGQFRDEEDDDDE